MTEKKAGRDEQGRFVKGHTLSLGNKGGPGRPPKAREERYAEIMMSACTFVKWRAICDKAVEQAIEGDTAARKWIAERLIGPVKQKVEYEDTGPIKLIFAGNIDPGDV